MENRRNYYRILQVQPDAPQALITASYRTLMQKLRYHPDLGGDHWNAALLNEAFYVLSDPDRRKAYDASLGDKLFGFQRQDPRAAQASPAPGQAAARGNERRHAPEPPWGTVCRFCRTAVPAGDPASQAFCTECRSSLQTVSLDGIYPALRRAVKRVELQGEIHYYTEWPQNPRVGRLCNISPGGLALRLSEPLAPGMILKIESMLLSAVGSVVRTRPDPESRLNDVGVKLLTASFNLRQGTFVEIEV